jgi:hypothetical protein
MASSQQTGRVERILPHWHVIALGVCVFLATLWDFRLFGVRVFDLFSLAILLILMAKNLWDNRGITFSSNLNRLASIIIVYSIFAFLVFRHQSSIVIIVGSILLVGSTLLDRELMAMGPWYRWFAWVHIAAFSLQLFIYFIFHKILDFHEFYGQSSRIFNNPQQRGSGLFQEPNSYCLAIFMLVASSTAFRASRTLTMVAGITMMISQSLWGVAGASLLIVIQEIREDTNLHLALFKITKNIIILLSISLLFLQITRPLEYAYPPIIERLAHLESDSSLRERYLVNNTLGPGQIPLAPPPVPVFQLPPMVQLLVGSGLSTHYFLDHLPANGFALIGKSFGFLGSLLLLWALIKLLKPLPRHERWAIICILAFSTTNYPLFTYLIYWVWLSYLLLPKKRFITAVFET